MYVCMPITDDKAKLHYLMSSLLQHVYKTMAGYYNYKLKNMSQTSSKSIQSTFRLEVYLKL